MPASSVLDLIERRSHAETGHQYARDVVSGRIVACKWIKLACQRHLNDLKKSEDERYPYEFDEAMANRPCRFIEELPHVKGEWAKDHGKIHLEPWQCFIVCSIYGWLRRSNRTRRFRLAFTLVPRKNAKSTLAAGVSLYMLCADGEMGAEVYAGATSERQALEIFFETARLMAENTPALQKAFGLKVNSKSLIVPGTASKLKALVGKPGDGNHPSCAIIDEYHEHESDHMVHAMRKGMGARLQPLLWFISTAGSTIGGPCYLQQRIVEQILEGSIQRDEVFGLIYTIDESDDWTSPEALRKANPNLGVSIYEEFLREEQNAAIQSPHEQNGFRTKHLNSWVGATTAWMNMAAWQKQGNAELHPEDFIGEPCFVGCDLASKLDITAVVFVFRKQIEEQDHFYVFGRYYVPEKRLQLPEVANYQGWVSSGHLIATPGNAIDFMALTQQTSNDCRRYGARELAYDERYARQFAQEVEAESGTITVEIPQQTRFLSEPMKQVEALVIDGRLHHDANPCMTWMMSNVVARADANDNIFPRKERDCNKIDGPVALFNAMCRALVFTPLIEAGIL